VRSEANKRYYAKKVDSDPDFRKREVARQPESKSEANKKYYAKKLDSDPEFRAKMNASHREWRRANPDKMDAKNARRREKKKEEADRKWLEKWKDWL